MKTLLLKTKDKAACSFKVIHTDNFKITDKCIYYNCGGSRRILKSDLLAYLGTVYETSENEHELISSHFIGLENDYLIKCTNGDMISFDYELDKWIVNDDEIINGDDIQEAIDSIYMKL